jgi:ParB-like chromosome segregation protein Spo0J
MAKKAVKPAGAEDTGRAPEKSASATPAQAPDNTSKSELPADYPLHPITEDYDDLTEEESAALRESLSTVGQIVEVIIWNGQIVDGRHRAKLCKELGLNIKYFDISSQAETEDDMRRVVQALNEHRRARTKPLSTAEKRARIETALKVHPNLSNRQIAEMAGAHHETVGSVRAELEGRGEFRHAETRTDRKGREQQAHKPKPEPQPLPDVETMSLKEVQAELQSPAPTPERKQQLWHRLDALGKPSIPAPVPSVDAPHKREERARAAPPSPPSTVTVSADDILEIAFRVRREITRNDVVTLCNWAIAVAQEIVKTGGGR